jgi:hypothetical protein
MTRLEQLGQIEQRNKLTFHILSVNLLALALERRVEDADPPPRGIF